MKPGWKFGDAFCRSQAGGFAVVLLLCGCAASSREFSQPKPGRGIAEYRQLARDARRSVAATVDSLDALSRAAPAGGKALDRFDSAVHELEVTSVKTRARAEAIMARGQAYFDEWQEQLALAANQVSARAESERYARLHERFTQVRERSAEVRAEFRPFMMKLREFRATLDKSPRASESGSTRAAMDALKVSGRRVLETLEAVSKSLDDAEVELRATQASKH